MIRHFNGHPYGRDPLAAIATIPQIDDVDLKRFLSRYFLPANITAAVSGDIDRQQALSGIRELMAALSPAPAMQRQLAMPPETPPVMILIHKPGQVQSQEIGRTSPKPEIGIPQIQIPSSKNYRKDYRKRSNKRRKKEPIGSDAIPSQGRPYKYQAQSE